MRFLFVLIMFLAGFCISLQGPISARLRVAVESPVMSATLSFLSGTLALLCITATGVFGGAVPVFVECNRPQPGLTWAESWGPHSLSVQSLPYRRPA